MLDFYQHLPQHINPIAFQLGFFSVRWYSISYILGFVSVYLVLLWRIRKDEFNSDAQISNFHPPAGGPISNEIKNPKNKKIYKIQNTKYEIRNKRYEIQNTLLDFLLIVFFAGLLGGRLGYVLFYNLNFYLRHLMQIFWPFDNAGFFIGFYGMSFHGAMIFSLAAAWVYSKRKNINFWQWADFIVVAAALGYFWGRLGNFLNGELYGRPTRFSLGMYFADDNFLRHPAQLYDAFASLVLFWILWKMRMKKNTEGFLVFTYFSLYGMFRFLVEFFRQPDPQLGLYWNLLSMGQILSLAIIAGSGLIAWKKIRSSGIMKET